MFRTMLVENSILFRETLRDGLHQTFPLMEITEAGDGLEALREVGFLPPDLIFMAIKLPGENGLELTAKIKKIHPNIMIVILTSYDLPEYLEAAAGLKADDFFSKNSRTIDDVIAWVKLILARKGFTKMGQVKLF